MYAYACIVACMFACMHNILWICIWYCTYVDICKRALVSGCMYMYEREQACTCQGFNRAHFKNVVNIMVSKRQAGQATINQFMPVVSRYNVIQYIYVVYT